MDREDFIIRVYCMTCEQYEMITKKHRIRRGGVEPALSDEEVITIEICGEYFKQHTDQDIFEYFRSHYQDYFPNLQDRSLFVRQSANLWLVKAAIQQRLSKISGQAEDEIQVIDTMPLPVCEYVRSRRDRCFKPDADYGYCAAKELHYYGFKLGLRIARSGMITHFPLLPARPHDVQFLDDLTENVSGIVSADKGFLDATRQALLAQRHGVELITPVRKNMTDPLPKSLRRAFRRLRKRVETVASQLSQRFDIQRIRTRDLWHFQHRLIRKILAHTVAVFFNLQLGRSPLDLDGLIDP